MPLLITAGAVLPVAVLTACSGKPNDLRHYGDDDPAAAVQAPPPVAAQPAPAGAPGTQVTPQSSTRRPPPQLERYALSEADLADEEVTLASPTTHTVQDRIADCDQPLRADTAAVAGYGTTWTYQTGSTLSQYVAAYDEPAVAVVDAVRDGLDCGRYLVEGAEYRVDPPFDLDGVSGVDAQLSWCSQSEGDTTCTVLLTKGKLFTILAVTASTESRAKAAVIRIAPRAVTALNRA